MCKGIIVKRNVFVHLRGVFPRFLELIESYDTPAFYANEYSIDQKGRKIQRGTGGSPEGKGHNEEEEEEEGEGDDDDDEKGASTYKSRAPLLALLILLAQRSSIAGALVFAECIVRSSRNLPLDSACQCKPSDS